MPNTELKTSTRLLRAAEAEREDLCRQRARLAAARDAALARLREIEARIAAIDERERLLDHLAPNKTGDVAPAISGSPIRETSTAPFQDAAIAVNPAASVPAANLLRGPAIRETAVRVLMRHGGIEALHYRQWFDLLTREGYTVAGKDGLAVFLTQISRSPAVRKGTQSGVYELDRDAPCRLTRRLEQLQAQLRELTSRTPGTTDLSEVRTRRQQLTKAIGQTERALEEARRVLSTRARDGVEDGAPPSAAVV